MDPTEFGFFTFNPDEVLDLDRLEGVLRAAEDEAGAVDVVVLPESSVTLEEIEPLEAVLGAHGVWCVIAGVRELKSGEGGLGGNSVHVGVRQELVWRHARQHKHHRWCLDGRQITQYHLGGALSPNRRWWEAVAVPRRSLEVIDQGGVTVAALVCEDLARLEPVADLVRAIGPSLVVTLLLDGPQLASRWTARYASVLADDPGSAVCTLTSYGMVRRSRPPGCPASRVVALWKDASGGLTEIELEDGADGVLIATSVSVSGCRTADGRRHAGTTTLTLAGAHSVRGLAGHAAPVRPARAEASELPPLDEQEVSKATSWCEALAEAVLAGPTAVDHVLTDATARAWRTDLDLPPPGRLFVEALEALRAEIDDPPTIAGLHTAACRLARRPEAAAVVTGTLVRMALEQRVLAEVGAGRLAPEVLARVADRPCPSPGA